MQDFSGGGANLKFFGFWVCMSRAAKLRAVARGFGGMFPQENLKKRCNFVRFEGYFHYENPLKKNYKKEEFFH